MLKTIKHGSSGNEVKIAQYLTGYAKRKEASGNFDANFVSSVCAWQRQYGLSPDGIIGAKTWAKIAEKAPTCSTARNRTSAATCALQLLLGGLTVDGIFGSQTKSAVVAYQSSKGLAVDGICGAKTWASLITQVNTSSNTETPTSPATSFKQPVDFKQYDSRWGSIVFTSTGNKKQTIKTGGCGPTAAADVVATLKDSSVTPPILAELAVKHGYRTANSGTAWAFFKWVANKYGFSKFVESSTLATLKACIDAGGYVVCSMGKGYWTSGGHYICAWKYDGNYIYANDPASSSRKKQNQTDFMKQRKRIFCFYP